MTSFTVYFISISSHHQYVVLLLISIYVSEMIYAAKRKNFLWYSELFLISGVSISVFCKKIETVHKNRMDRMETHFLQRPVKAGISIAWRLGEHSYGIPVFMFNNVLTSH